MSPSPVYNFTDNAEGILSAAISDVDTSIPLIAGDGVKFSASNFIIWNQAECMIASSRNDDVVTILTRGANGTSAVAHSIGTRIRERYGRLHRDEIVSNIFNSVSLATTTPTDISSSGIAGTSASAAANDHVHKGITSVTVSGNPNSYGVISLIQGNGASLSQSGGSITIGAPAGGGSFTLNFNNNPILSGQATLIQGAGASLSQSGASITIASTGTSHTLNFNNNPILAGQTTLVQGTGASLSQSGASITIAGGDDGVRSMAFWRSDVVATGIANQGLNLPLALTELEATQWGTRQLVGTGDIGGQVSLHVNCCVVVAVAATIGVSILDVSNTANSLVGVTFSASTTGPRIAKSAYTNRATWLSGDKTIAVYTASGNGTADFIFKDISLRYKA